MVTLALTLLATATGAPAHVAPPRAPRVGADRPIRVWLGGSTPVPPGEHVRVFVRTVRDGYLTVLRRTTNGNIVVLFPTTPAEETFVEAGTYEVRGTGTRGAFTAAGPAGTGLVLAALSPTPYRTGEFARRAAWNPATLVPSWADMDAEGALSDIVQRMLGDGYFEYDIVPYGVTARGARLRGVPLAQYDECKGCVLPEPNILIAPTIMIGCDSFIRWCQLAPIPAFRRRGERPQPPPRPTGRVLGIPSSGRSISADVARRVRQAAPPAVAMRRASGGDAVPPLRGTPPPAAGKAVATVGRVRLVMGRSAPRSPTARRVPVTVPATPSRTVAAPQPGARRATTTHRAGTAPPAARALVVVPRFGGGNEAPRPRYIPRPTTTGANDDVRAGTPNTAPRPAGRVMGVRPSAAAAARTRAAVSQRRRH